MADSSEARDLRLNRLADEFAARQRAGERPRLDDYCARHPDLADDIRSLFPALVELERAKVDAGPDLAVTAAPHPPVTDLGDFRLLREVGRGGMGVVYEAEQVSLGRRVAIKLLPPGVFRDAGKRRRFEREAKAAAKLHHTNIVPVHGCGEHDAIPYYVMQYIAGLGLDAVIDELARSPAGGRTLDATRPPAGDRAALSNALAHTLVVGPAAPPTTTDAASGTRPDRGPPVSLAGSGVHLPGSGESGSSGTRATYWESVARVGVQVAGALAYAHRLGVLHRDIKPSNLLLDLDGIVWVTDFGLAKADDSDNLTHTGDLLGTLRYMPPEAFEGRFDARGDVYGLGLTLFEMIALRPAYEERDRNKLIKQVTTGDPPRLGKVRRDAPRNLVTIVEKATDKDPARRYPTAAAMADDLQRFLDGRPIAARRATELERVWMWVRRRPATAGLVVALFLCLVAGSVVSTAFAVRADGFARDAEAREREARQERVRADREKVVAQQQQARAEAGEQDATAQRNRADAAAEVTRENLYYAQMHLALQAWREHRGLPHMRQLLAEAVPPAAATDRRGWEWFYVNSLPYQNLRTLTESGPTKKPCTVAWHVGSKRLAEGTADGLIRVWDVDREQITLTLRAPTPDVPYHGVRWLAWSPAGDRLAAGSRDGTVRIWEATGGRELHVLRGHEESVLAVAFSSDGRRVASWDRGGAIKIWDAGSGGSTAEVRHAGGQVTAGAWSLDDKTLATGHANGMVTVSAARTGATPTKIKAHVDWIYHLAWGPDGRLATTSANDFFVSVWDVAAGKVVLGPLRHSHGITSIAWEPTGGRLATGSMDETVKVWNAATGHEELTLRSHRAAVTSLAWGPDDRLASGGEDGSLRVWTAVRDQESGVLSGHAGRATAVAWSRDGKRLASAGDDGVVRVWDAATRREVRPLAGHDRGKLVPQFGLIRSLAWSPDGTHLASAGLDGTTKVWDVEAGRLVYALPADHGAVWCVAWSADGRLAAGSADGTLRIVEGLPRQPQVRPLPPAQDSRGRVGVRAVAWGPHGDRLATGGTDGHIKLWDPAGGTVIAGMDGSHRYAVKSVAFSPDGRQLASAGGDRLVITWDARTGSRLKTMRGHNDFVDAVVWSPDGTRLASASIDNSVRVWVPQTGAEALVLRGSSAMFHDVSWHPDGAQIAAASSDGRVWVWDATRGFERDSTPRALPYVARAVASGTARGEDCRWYAEAFLRAGKPAEAMAVLNDADGVCQLSRKLSAALTAAARGELIAWCDERRANDPDRPGWLAELGCLLTEAGRTREAVPHFAAVSAARPQDVPLAVKVAALQCWFGRSAELVATRRRLLDIAAATTDAGTAEQVARACCIVPLTDAATREAVLAVARAGAKVGRGEWRLLALGMAEFRCGNYAAADAALLAASAGKAEGLKAVAAFYRGMSLFRLGDVDAARRVAVEAAAKMKPLPADHTNPLADGAAHDDLIVWLAFLEAKNLIEFESR